MNQGYAGQNPVADKPREPSLNDRLNSVSSRLQVSCERIEAVLSRVNGTPQAAPGSAANKLAQINPTLPMSTIVEHLESAQSRLQELVAGVERIA